MATRIKTTEFWFPAGTTANDVTDTNLTQITLYMPETVGSTPFKSVFVEYTMHDRNTNVGSIDRHQVSLQLASAGYSVVNNTNVLGTSGEQHTLYDVADFTAYFNTNWTSGTSQTCDLRVLADASNASPLSPSWVNITARVVMTYEYDDTSTTQIKTIRIPLATTVTTLGTSKPSAMDTIPALDTELPESTKTYRQTVVVLQGQSHLTTSDVVIRMQIDTNTQFDSDSWEHGSNVSQFFRNSSIESFTTNATHSFYVWSSVGSQHHLQAWLVVTYEFDASASSNYYVSLLLPCTISAPMGGTTSSDYQRGQVDLYIEEPTTITTMQVAFMLYWEMSNSVTGLNLRLGSSSFTAYTNSAGTQAGSDMAWVKDNSAFTLARGKNTLNVDMYRTTTTRQGYNVSGYFIVNYTCGKPTSGYGVANSTVEYLIAGMGTGAPDGERVFSSTAVSLTETDYYFNSTSFLGVVMTSGSLPCYGASIGVERLASGENGLIWEKIYGDLGGTDGEQGPYFYFGNNPRLFKRFVNDADPNRLDIETARRYRMSAGYEGQGLYGLKAILSKHNITFTVSGTISGSNGGTVNLYLHDYLTGELLQTTSRSGNGSYSFTVFDNTRDMIVYAYEDNSYIGSSGKGTATGSP